MGSLTPNSFQALVDVLRLTLTTSAAAPLTTASPTVVSSPMVTPVPYSGVAEECKEFLLQCSLTLKMQLQQFPTEKVKISSIIFLLRE